MNWKKYKHLYFWLFCTALISFLTFYQYMTLLPKEENYQQSQQSIALPLENNAINTDTKVYLREEYAICAKYNLACSYDKPLEGSARAELNNISRDELLEKYPKTAGWDISWLENKVVLREIRAGLCPLHQQRWHLAPDETGELVAVYLGPPQVGDEAGVIKITNIRLAELPLVQQDKIRNRKLEFIKWDDLIGALDSLAE